MYMYVQCTLYIVNKGEEFILPEKPKQLMPKVLILKSSSE